jgi:hypothetical protein
MGHGLSPSNELRCPRPHPFFVAQKKKMTRPSCLIAICLAMTVMAYDFMLTVDTIRGNASSPLLYGIAFEVRFWVLIGLFDTHRRPVTVMLALLTVASQDINHSGKFPNTI